MDAPRFTAGYKLQDRPTAKFQYRNGRREYNGIELLPFPVIMSHTFQNNADLSGPDTAAENGTDWLTRRTDYGSYHVVYDRDSVIPTVHIANEAWGSRGGFNRCVVHISGALKASDWPRLNNRQRSEYAHSFAHAAAWVAKEIKRTTGYDYPRPRVIDAARIKAARPGVIPSGFTEHSSADPERRHDPGPGKPWQEAFGVYRELLAIDDPIAVEIGITGQKLSKNDRFIREAQRLLGVTVDGKFWDKSLAALEAALDDRDLMDGQLAAIAQTIQNRL